MRRRGEARQQVVAKAMPAMGALGLLLKRARALTLAAALALTGPLATARACDLSILFALDVSSSVSPAEYALQSEGHAAAFRDPDVVAAILSMRGVRAAVMHWSGARHQTSRIDWTDLTSEAEILRFASEIAGLKRRVDNLETAIGSALAAAAGAWNGVEQTCLRKVIDISGDGANNDGVDPEDPRRRLFAMGVTVNAVVIANPLSGTGAEPDVVLYYRERVIGGPGAFLEIADGYEDYARAFRKKLLQELERTIAGLDRPAPL